MDRRGRRRVGAHWRLTGRLGMTPGYVARLAATNDRSWTLTEARGPILITLDAGRTWTDVRAKRL